MANVKVARTIFGLFRNQEEAELAVNELAGAGFGA